MKNKAVVAAEAVSIIYPAALTTGLESDVSFRSSPKSGIWLVVLSVIWI